MNTPPKNINLILHLTPVPFMHSFNVQGASVDLIAGPLKHNRKARTSLVRRVARANTRREWQQRMLCFTELQGYLTYKRTHPPRTLS